MIYNDIKTLLNSSKKIVITMHSRPDADALGSSLALAHVLTKIGHDVSVISPNEFPNFLCWLQGSENVITYTKQQKIAEEKIADAEIVFCLDFSAISRAEKLGPLIKSSTAIKIIIDHHIDAENFGTLQIWDSKASATAILIFRFLKELKLLNFIDKNIANCLYSGILTDTGSFQHPTTTREAHLVTAELIKYGANVSMASRKIFNTNSVNRLKFLGFAITDRLTIMHEYHTAYFSVKKADWDAFSLENGDTEGLVNYSLSLNNIMIGALISDQGNYIRLSLRSQGDIPVNDIAKKHFDGGGHKNAAGGKSYLSLEKTIQKFEKIIKNQKLVVS